MFKDGIEYLESIKDTMNYFPPYSFFFCEYLQKPKHNCLKYERCPQNHLVLFDAYVNDHWMTYEWLESTSKILGIDVIPQFKLGPTTIQELRDYFIRNSYLGNEKIEGVVVKNYHEDILVGGNLRPLFVKIVRPEFKEKMKSGTSVRQTLDEWFGEFKSEARWLKAIQAIKEAGAYTQSPKDIGPLIIQIHKDISEEEKINIGHHLYRHFISEILRRSTGGFADWYKEQLLKTLEDTNAEGNQEGIKESGQLSGDTGMGETLA